MPNSYTAVPNVIPGNLTVAGNLKVRGGQIELGGVVPFGRVQQSSGGVLSLTSNLATDGATQESGSVTSLALLLDGANGTLTPKYMPGGGAMEIGHVPVTVMNLINAFLHSGDTAENQVAAVTLRASVLGGSGTLRLQMGVTPTVQGGVATTVRVYLGATVLVAWSFATTAPHFYTLFFHNANNPSSQDLVVIDTPHNSSPQIVRTTPAINTTIDQVFKVTLQAGATTDTTWFDFVHGEIVASNIVPS
jgi:hypothetical protein